MDFGRTPRSTLAWGLAGLPVAVTLGQTLLALFETTAGSTPLAPLADALRSVAVLDAAALAFWRSPVIVMGLFVLIAGAWLAQGVATLVYEHRDAAFAAAGVVSVLFFALFVGVYSPLLSRGLPASQVFAFFVTPLLAAGAAVGAVRLHDWEETVVEEATADLAALETDVEAARSAFETAFENRIGDLSAFQSVAPTGVERAEERRAEFRETCESFREEIGAARSHPDPETVRRRVTDLRARIDALDPVDAVTDAEETLRRKLRSGVRTEFGSLTVRSGYGEPYVLANLPTRYREASIPAFDTTVHVERFGDAVVDRIEGDVDLPTIADGLEAMGSHLDRVEEYLADRESAVESHLTAAHEELETVEGAVGGFDGRVGDRLADYVIDGRHEEIDGVRDLRSRLAAARDRLHDCQFDRAERLAREAEAASGELIDLVEFLQAAVATVADGGTSVTVPGSLDSSLLVELAPAVERDFAVTCRVRDGRIEVERHGDVPDETPADDRNQPSRPKEGASSGAGTGRSKTVPPDETVDAVLYLLRELQTAAKEADGDHVHVQTTTLPEVVATSSVLSQVERFANGQPDVVASVEVQDGAPPGFIELEPADGVVAERAATVLHERYRERYG